MRSVAGVVPGGEMSETAPHLAAASKQTATVTASRRLRWFITSPPVLRCERFQVVAAAPSLLRVAPIGNQAEDASVNPRPAHLHPANRLLIVYVRHHPRHDCWRGSNRVRKLNKHLDYLVALRSAVWTLLNGAAPRRLDTVDQIFLAVSWRCPRLSEIKGT